ncbi:CoA-binding protein [Noviherbaspirillum massiliense]|uniref:CoA-binding protein n=1 Tax=Noviherbaspirillum massiliense TaxID=1465823 RepID=UPI00031ABEBD|nr:CoA-binding protein [Noviherbaspirillum massiliense]
MEQQDDPISAILRQARTIAVVGLSEKDHRPSHTVARYLQMQGYRVIPVNPVSAGAHILGELCYAGLENAAAALEKEGTQIDIVDCFRKSEYIPQIVDDAIRIGARCVWMQLGVSDPQAAAKAEAAGLFVVMDKCIKIEHGYRVA